MTLPEALAALVAAGKIRSAWLPGMLNMQRMRLIWHGETSREWARPRLDEDALAWSLAASFGDASMPDLSDPLTVYGLLLLAREAWGDPGMYSSTEWTSGDLWGVFGASDSIVTHRHDSEADAIVAAIIAAAKATEPTP